MFTFVITVGLQITFDRHLKSIVVGKDAEVDQFIRGRAERCADDLKIYRWLVKDDGDESSLPNIDLTRVYALWKRFLNL